MLLWLLPSLGQHHVLAAELVCHSQRRLRPAVQRDGAWYSVVLVQPQLCIEPGPQVVRGCRWLHQEQRRLRADLHIDRRRHRHVFVQRWIRPQHRPKDMHANAQRLLAKQQHVLTGLHAGQRPAHVQLLQRLPADKRQQDMHTDQQLRHKQRRVQSAVHVSWTGIEFVRMQQQLCA